MSSRPWAEGTDAERWDGYFTRPGSGVLRNKVGATTAEQLHDAENDLFEVRLLELRAEPTLVARTYDLPHLCALHLHLFQDIYEWAGEPRTVGLAKGGGESFVPPMSLERPAAHVRQRIYEGDLLRGVTDADLAGELAYLYDYLNYAHPFREGNGRTQREFFEQLLAESGRGLDWQPIDMSDLHSACHRARNEMDLEPMREVFKRIVTRGPSYPPSR